MNATEAKALLKPIPNNQFMVGWFGDGEGKCCGVGHLVRLKSNNPNNYDNEHCSDFQTGKEEVYIFARDKVNEFLRVTHNTATFKTLSSVNNTLKVDGYTQDNPKDRVIALLNDMIEAGY